MQLVRLHDMFLFQTNIQSLEESDSYLLEFNGALNFESSESVLQRFGNLTGIHISRESVTRIQRSPDKFDNDALQKEIDKSLEKIKQAIKDQHFNEDIRLTITFLCNHFKVERNLLLKLVSV